jgi:murein DD-endopeptidase MepM/ murein hydrolase activator NlpD
MAARGPLNILVVGSDGRRLLCLRVDARLLWAGLALALAAGVAGSGATLARRGHVATAAAVSLPLSLEERQCGLLELVQQRLPELQAEIAGWREAQASIRKVLRVRQAMATEPEEPPRAGAMESVISRQLDRLLTIVQNEARNLRALEPFAAQAARALAGLPSRWPVRAAVSSEFGRRRSPWSGSLEFHEGIDIVARPGTRVVAPSSGSVAFVGSTPEYGNTVLLDHGNEIRTRFSHLERVTVSTGQTVERGQPIALSGNTGRSTGPHLHYEIIVRGRPVNPRHYLAE